MTQEQAAAKRRRSMNDPNDPDEPAAQLQDSAPQGDSIVQVKDSASPGDADPQVQDMAPQGDLAVQVQDSAPPGDTDAEVKKEKEVTHEQTPASWNKFFVFLAGNTNGAHHDLVEKLKAVGHTEVNSLDECDYVLVFCPVASRVGTDVKEALDKTPAGKPVILVVMHHTFDPDRVLAESRRIVTDPNVLLTVDCLFYDQHILKCSRNETGWCEVKKSLHVPEVMTKMKNQFDVFNKRSSLALKMIYICLSW
uniref:Uncharacterized protein n=1 Tax=Anabas testudineus TaxID=64144 RepID=A0A7N6C0J7_ANATE